MRTKYIEVVCDYCNSVIGHYNDNATSGIKNDGGIANKHGDFCDENCCELFKAKKVENMDMQILSRILKEC